jgi:hypothetical protein
MINEHDIADMCQLDKLHEGDKFIVSDDDKNLVFKVRNSYNDFVFCYDAQGFVHKFARWIKVKKV